MRSAIALHWQPLQRNQRNYQASNKGKLDWRAHHHEAQWNSPTTAVAACLGPSCQLLSWRGARRHSRCHSPVTVEVWSVLDQSNDVLFRTTNVYQFTNI